MDTSVAAAAAEAPKKRIRVQDPVEARVELINGMFTGMPRENKEAMNAVREAVEEAARRIHAASKLVPPSGAGRDGRPAPGYDVGRLIAAMDALQHAKDTACVAFILPYAEKDE